jgi:hypothetical protein
VTFFNQTLALQIQKYNQNFKQFLFYISYKQYQRVLKAKLFGACTLQHVNTVTKSLFFAFLRCWDGTQGLRHSR